jgi:putative redox protein
MTQTRKLTIPNRSGEALAALLDLPVDGAPTAFALLAHCFTCTKDYKGLYHLSRALTAEGIGVLRFDFAGLGESGGIFADTGLLSNVEDLIAAAEFLAGRFEAPKLLIGHSLGGQAVLMAAPAIPSAAAVVTIGAPADPRQVLRHLGPARETIAARGEAAVSISGRAFTLRRKFLDDLQGVDPTEVLAALRRPLLVLHSPRDEIVPVDNAMALFQAAQQPKSLVALGEADHLLSRTADARYAGAVIAAWAQPYVAPAPAADAPAESRITARTGDEGFATEIRAGRHRLTADEPAAAGGTDRGPTPFDLLVAALGACTSMTLRMYADRKGWPLEAATVRLAHRKMHASECTSCETREGLLDRIEREIELEGPLDPDQRRRLLQIADRCPVHRTLTGETQIVTRLAGEPETGEDR